MKKTRSIFAILVALCLLLAACGAPPAVVTTPTATEVSAPAPTKPAEAGPIPVEGEPYVNHFFTTVDEYKAATGKTIDSFGESPMLADLVKSGQLPPVNERLPKDVAVVRPREFIGVYSDQIRTIGYYEGADIFTQFTEDMQQFLLTTDPKYSRFYPNIIKGWELSDDSKSLRIYLREGMKWSDGDDFNADDFAFWYTDMLQDPELTPEISEYWKPGDQLMGFTKVDEFTVEYTFAIPYYRAVDVFAQGFIFAPEHFIKLYMPKYSDNAEALAKGEGFETWQQAVQFHAGTTGTPFSSDPRAPTLNPWILKDKGAASVLWERNPYYWRVDTAGNQLPYADTIMTLVTDNIAATGPVKAMSGELDFVDYSALNISDFPVLKQNEEKGNYKIYSWERLDDSFAMGFALNYTHKDPVLRQIFNDIRFRQALSLAINRDEISETLFFGLPHPFTSPASPAWTGYEDWMGTYYAEYDVDRANALLDEMGLQWDNNHQWRLRSDGQPLTIIGTYCTEWLAYAEDLLDMVAGYWANIGVKFEPKFVPEATLQTQFVANDTDIGLSNSDGGTEFMARNYYPIRLIPPWHWGEVDCCAMSSYPWRVWLDTKGAEGEEPPESIKRIYELVQEWENTPYGTPEYKQLINEVIKINVENLYYFGTVSAPPLLFIISNRLGNAPQEDGTFGAWQTAPWMYETFFIRP